MFAPRKAERRGTVPYGIKAAREEYKKLKPTLAAREREERRRKRQIGLRNETGIVVGVSCGALDPKPKPKPNQAGCWIDK